MSKNQPLKILKPSEVSKTIILKPNKIRSHLEWFDHSEKYRDENIAEYELNKNAFIDAANTYNKLNMDTMMGRKVRRHVDYENILNCDFLKEKERDEEECDLFCCCLKCKPNKTGRLLRKRSIRQMHYTEEPKVEVCLTEPWFKRYLILNKFIWAARTTIIQNRLLNVLNKLKKLTYKDIKKLEMRSTEQKCEEYHCHPIFLKFL